MERIIIRKQMKQFSARAVRQYACLASIYIVLIFLLPPNHETLHAYNLTALQYQVILFAVALPSLAVWLAAFIGYSKLRQYAGFIKKTPEGTYFDQLATGCAWLAWSLPIPTIMALLLNALANHWPGFHSAAIIITNYLNLLLPLVAFTVIAGAARGLTSQTRIKFSLANARAIVLGFVTVGVLFCFLTFQRFDLNSLASTHNPYFLPIWLMVLTVTVPYLYAWFVGTLAAYELSLFSRQIQGVLYRQALRFLVIGLLAVVLSSIAVQYANSIEPRTGRLVLDYKLVFTTLFRIIGGLGFVALVMGANRLKKIEEV